MEYFGLNVYSGFILSSIARGSSSGAAMRQSCATHAVAWTQPTMMKTFRSEEASLAWSVSFVPATTRTLRGRRKTLMIEDCIDSGKYLLRRVAPQLLNMPTMASSTRNDPIIHQNSKLSTGTAMARESDYFGLDVNAKWFTQGGNAVNYGTEHLWPTDNI